MNEFLKLDIKDGTNLEFNLNQISLKFRIQIEYRIEYEYSVASNYTRILNGVEMSCRDVVSSRGYRHKSVPESSASWPYASILLFTFSDENDFQQPPNLSSHILCTHTN